MKVKDLQTIIFYWFLMIPSIATEFQYVNSTFFIFFLAHYMFRPLRAIFRRDIQLDVFKCFKDYFYYNGSVARTVKSTSYFKYECEVSLQTFEMKLSELFEQNEDEVVKNFTVCNQCY
jgi:hypothetical protein